MIHKAKSEAAVSPVIGTILLVAIAVVLVAIILVVVMGFSGDPNEKKVGLNAKSSDGPNATLLLYGGASIDDLVKLEMIDQDSPYGMYVDFWNSTSGDAYVGIPYPVEKVAQPPESMDVYDTRINVRGTFSDGTEVILLVQPMTFHNVDRSANAPAKPIVNIPYSTSKIAHKIDVAYSYENFDVPLSEVKTAVLSYRSSKSSTITNVTVTLTADSETSGHSKTVTVAGLVQGIDYEFWGTVTLKDGRVITGDSTTMRTLDPASVEISVYEKYNTLILTFTGLSTHPNDPTVYARLYVGDENGNVLFSTKVTTPSGGGAAEGTFSYSFNLVKGTKYTVWGVLHINDGEYPTSVKPYTPA